MNPKIQLFIEEHIWEIDKNLFAALYEVLYADLDITGLDIRDFTETLLEADINPEDYMDNIPPDYLYKSEGVEMIDIREGTQTIQNSAFFGCVYLKKIYLPHSVKEIEPQAFWDCNNIEELVIMNPSIDISDEAFSGFYPIDNIHYNGTKDQYLNSDFPFVGKHVYCTDGELENK